VIAAQSAAAADARASVACALLVIIKRSPLAHGVRRIVEAAVLEVMHEQGQVTGRAVEAASLGLECTVFMAHEVVYPASDIDVQDSERRVAEPVTSRGILKLLPLDRVARGAGRLAYLMREVTRGHQRSSEAELGVPDEGGHQRSSEGPAAWRTQLITAASVATHRSVAALKT